jgi:hypothetical protein
MRVFCFLFFFIVLIDCNLVSYGDNNIDIEQTSFLEESGGFKKKRKSLSKLILIRTILKISAKV